MLSQSGSKEKQMLRLSSLFIGPGPHPWDGATHIQHGSFSKGSLPRSTLIDTPRVCFHGDTEFSSVGLKIYYHSGLGQTGSASGVCEVEWRATLSLGLLIQVHPSLSVFPSFLCLPLVFPPHFLIPENGRALYFGTLIYVVGIQGQGYTQDFVVDVPPVLATSPQPLGHLFSTSYAEGIAPSPC